LHSANAPSPIKTGPGAAGIDGIHRPQEVPCTVVVRTMSCRRQMLRGETIDGGDQRVAESKGGPSAARHDGSPAPSFDFFEQVQFLAVIARRITCPTILVSPLFQLFLFAASSRFDVRRWRFACRRTSTWCLHDRVLSRSRMALLPGGSASHPKLTDSR
jgi:hypothetical protein